MTTATIEDEFDFDDFDFDYQDVDPEAVDIMMSMNDALGSAEGEDE